MGKKAMLFIIIGVVLGVGLAAGGVYFMVRNGAIKPEEEVVEVFDLKDGHRFTLQKVQVPLKQTTSKMSVLQADFTIIFKSAEAVTLAENMESDIKDAILGVFESKTSADLNAEGARTAMKEPLLQAIRELYNQEEDRENIMAVQIPSFMVVEI